MKEEIVNKVIVIFADYVENYYDRDSTPADVEGLVNEHFDEFIEWAYEDLVIGEEDAHELVGEAEPAFRNSIIREVIQEFKMILGVRKYKKLYPLTDPARI